MVGQGDPSAGGPGFGARLRTSFAPLMHRLAFGLMLLGLALTVGGNEEDNLILTSIGLVSLAFGTLATISWWRARGWKLGYIGIVVGLLGVIVAAAALDEANCDCRSLLYFGISLAVIGAAGTIGRVRRRAG